MSTAAPPKPSGHTSLERQISEMERIVRARQRIVGERTAHVARRIRQKISSPIILLAALGSGVLIDRLIALISRRTGKSAPGSSSRPGMFTRLMEIIVLARTLLATWPATVLQRIVSNMSSWPKVRQPADKPSGYSSTPDFYP